MTILHALLLLGALVGTHPQQLAPPPATSRQPPPPPGGVVANPCGSAPTEEQLGGWIPWHTWLYAHDFGQLCYYQDANAALRGKPQAARRVVFMGDSITEMWRQIDPTFFTYGRVDRGISGQTTAQMLVRFRADVIRLDPQVVHIMGGINDIAGNTGVTSLRAIEDNIADMAELAQAHRIKVVIGSMLPTTRIPWRLGIKPAQAIARLNRWTQHYAHQHGFAYANYYDAMKNASGGMRAGMSADGVHPTPAGFRIMAAIVTRAIGKAKAEPDAR
jgi:lysophospholipase L1-like esterase